MVVAAMTFSHPLARSAKVFAAHSQDGMEQQILVIVTAVELDPQSERYKKRLVERLSAAARDHVAGSDRVTAFMLMNRPKDWRRSADARRNRPMADAGSIRHAWPRPM
jgi:hypothetical protein